MALKKAAQLAAQSASRCIPAVVISTGLMQNTVKARIGAEHWDSHIRKKYSGRKNILVHDPNNSLRTGDIISVSSGWRVSKTVHFVLEKLIAPFGSPAEERPPIPTPDERAAERERKREWKKENKNKKRKGLFPLNPIDSPQSSNSLIKE